MDPERYYNYTDIKVFDGTKPVIAGQAVPSLVEDADAEDAEVVYTKDQLSVKYADPTLVVGYGMPLKNVVKMANTAGIEPLFTMATDDKQRSFAFGGDAQTVSIAPKFDERLYRNEFVILDAAKRCDAKVILWANKDYPSDLLISEAAHEGIALFVPFATDRTLSTWQEAEGASLPKAVWRTCSHCRFSHDVRAVEANGWRCPTCGKLVRLSTDERIRITFDEGSFHELFADVAEKDPLGFPDFDAIIEKNRKRSGHDEGVRTGTARIEGIEVAAAVMEPAFMMASMGFVVGERITRLVEYATDHGLPLVIFSTSGGARMQEGLVSLMQMSKVSAALGKLAEAGGLFVSVLVDPVTGGVTASFATLGDVILAEPDANIGFAGRRVIQDTIRQTLPADFQTSEFALEHGLIDAIVERSEMRDALARLLRFHGYAADAAYQGEDAAADPAEAAKGADEASAAEQAPDADSEQPAHADQDLLGTLAASASSTFSNLREGLNSLAENVGQSLTEQTSKAGLWLALQTKGVADAPYLKPANNIKESLSTKDAPSYSSWESVKIARNPTRPTSLYYIDSFVDGFFELHGDRQFADDGAIITGLGYVAGTPVTIVAQEKGADLKSRIARRFGCPQPEGYRKAQRIMRQAERFGRPIVCLVDTQGAYCGKEAEERGIGNAISESLQLMSGLTVPIVSIIIGEGGSGGALALATSNKVAMLENAVYSVLSPEGFASILWKDGSRANEAADVMKMSAADALSLGIIEDVIPEGAGPAHENPEQTAAALWLYIANALEELRGLSPEELKAQRYDRFRSF